MADELDNLSEEELIARMAGEPPAAEAEPVPPAEEDPPKQDELPSWLSEIPEEDRVGVAERYLQSLTQEQRLQLPTVLQLVNSAYENGSEQTQQQIAEQSNEQAREAELTSQASSLADEIINGSLDPAEISSRLEGYGEVAGDTRQSEINDAVQESIWDVARFMGLSSIPAEVVSQAQGTDDYGAAISTYYKFFVNTAYNQGLQAAGQDASNKAKADFTVDRQRIRDEYEAELRAAGRLKDNVPPSLGDTVGVGSGRVQVDDRASEEDLLAAMSADLAMRKR